MEYCSTAGSLLCLSTWSFPPKEWSCQISARKVDKWLRYKDISEEGQVYYFYFILFYFIILPRDNSTIANARYSFSLALAGDGNIILIFCRNLILEKMTWWGFEPQTFRFRVGCSNHWATWPCPLEFTNFCKSIRFYCTLVHSLQKAHCWYSTLYPISAELVVPGNEIGGREIKSSLAYISTGVP